MATMVKERRTQNRSFAFAGPAHSPDECPLCAMCDYEPNDETIEAIRETRENKNLKRHTLAEVLAELYS